MKLLQQSSRLSLITEECDAHQKTRTDVQYSSISHGVTAPSSMVDPTLTNAGKYYKNS